MPTVREVYGALDQKFPFSRAQSWDKVGLLVGDQNASAKRVFICYEITPETLEEAQGHDCLVCYHPLIFRPLDTLDFKNPTVKMAATLVSRGQSLLCTHTALDGAPLGSALGDALAAQLGLQNVRVGAPFETQKLVKIQTYAPEEHAETVAEAMWQAGAGRIGNYHEASFQSSGIGTYTPQEGANPYDGEIGARAHAREIKIEVIAPREIWREVVGVMKAAHPYEEVAFEAFEILNAEENQRYGPLRIGEIEECSLENFVARVQNALHPPSIRLVKSGIETVRQVACSPGSGASFISKLEAGTVFVTGDIKHHDALLAQNRGVAILDVTHAATETETVTLMASALESFSVTRSAIHSNPFN